MAAHRRPRRWKPWRPQRLNPITDARAAQRLIRSNPITAFNSASSPWVDIPTDWIVRGSCIVAGVLTVLGFLLADIAPIAPIEPVAVVSADSVRAPSTVEPRPAWAAGTEER